MRNLLDKASAAQSLDDHRLMGSLHIPAALLPRSATHVQGIGCSRNHKAVRISACDDWNFSNYVVSAARPFFWSWRRSLAASASSHSRKVAIFGSAAVAFGQMI